MRMKPSFLVDIFESLSGIEEHRHSHVVTFTALVTGFFVVTSSVAMLFTPHYSFTDDFLSTLGTSRSSYPYIFNISVVLTALLLVPTYLSLHAILLRNIPEGNKKLVDMAFVVGMASSLALIGVGLLPAEGTTFYSHSISALVFFLAIGMYYFITTIVVIRILRKCHNFRKFLSPADYLGFAVIVLVFLLMDISTWYSRILQKTIVYGSLLFLVYLAHKIKKIDHINQVVHGLESPLESEALVTSRMQECH